MTPFSFADFSGGITDKDIPGANNRYSICDNFIIDQDGKPLQRDGFDILSATAFQPTAATRVARLSNFDIDSEILAWQNKKVFSLPTGSWATTPPTGAWAEVAGPGGGSSAQHAFNTNSAASLLDEAQWQHHIFMSSDSGDPVVKLYRDGSNVLQLRSAGLPEFGVTDSNGDDVLTPADGGLALAITLINDLRSKMITHYGTNGATAGAPNNLTSGHHSTHADLAAQATAVSASTVASGTGQTGTNTVIALLNILRTQYSSHISDAQKEDAGRAGFSFPAFRKYHAAPAAGGEAFYLYYDNATTTNQTAFQWRHFLNFSLADFSFSIPAGTTIKNVLAYLNDLRDKWNWHTYSLNTHFNAINWKGVIRTKFGTHATAIARVATYSWAQITPNLGPFIQYVTDLYREYLRHISHDSHILVEATNIIDSSFSSAPTDFWGTIALLGAAANAFSYHALETDITFAASTNYQKAGTTTNGSPTLTLATGGFTADQFKFLNLLPLSGDAPGSYSWTIQPLVGGNSVFGFQSPYNITASNTATPCVITLASNISNGQVGVQYLLSSLMQHYGLTNAQYFSPRSWVQLFDAKDFTLGSAASLQGFADLAKLLADALKAHELDRQTANSGINATKTKFRGNSFDVYGNNDGAAAQANGLIAFIHFYPDDTNFPHVNIYPSGAIFGDVVKQDRFDLAPQAASFNYQALFAYDYTVGANAFTDRGAPSTSINVIGFLNEDSGGATETGKFAASLANIYAYSNAANENWAHTDTTNFRKEIYRTLGNGQNFYRTDLNGVAGAVTNAATTFSDYSSDTFLFDQLELYTNGGAPENNRPPAATNIHIFGNVMYYAIGNKVFQSIPNDPDSVPSGFFEEFEENIVAVSSTRNVAVAFGKSRVYRLVGFFDELGRGSLTYERIFDRTGAISAQSIVKADNGIFFAGKDGFYFTDGYQCMRVTDLEKTFRTYTDTQAKRDAIQGTYDNITKKIYWTIPAGNSAVPNLLWVLDLKFGIKPDATPLTTHSKTSGFNPTALTYFNGQLYYGDGDGYVFVQTRGRNIDLVKNTGVAATSWAAETTRWDFKSCHSNYGSEMVRKYFERVTVQFEQQSTNLSATITSDADKGRVVSDLPVIRSRKLTDWGDSKIDWTASVYPAEAGNVIDEWRRFNGDGSLRSNYRAIEMKTAYCVIVASKDMGTATVANVSGNDFTVTLTSLVATRKWPLYSVGYFFRLAGVDYPITTRTSDSVIHIDATGLAAPAAGVATSYEIYGYPKNERARLMAYSIKLDAADENEHSSKGSIVTGGGNA